MSKKLPFTATLEARDTCLCLHVQRAGRALARHYDEALRPFGLTNGQFSLLMSLNRPEPPTVAPVAEVLAMDRTTLTAALKPLERRGLVRMEPHPSDRRAKCLILTDEGHAALIAALPAWREAQARIDRLLAPADPQAVRDALKRLS
ncbi:MarR family winged helix-turn-helix transcriptional regulator [Stappia stellulata]|uniref:MarR family winged helix-turn-helix transcriptional regulator n=1 Tax=Stappia stellulata TaxID=71235 RepID=UPI0003F5C459|nr:MarR family transcriptional regulator [Stappia stellulata]